MNEDWEQAERLLKEGLASYQSVAIAFSAGVDSTYLLAVAVEVLGTKAVAVTADSPSLARKSLNQAVEYCRQQGVTHHIVKTDEFEREAYLQNNGMRCFECKSALMRAMTVLVEHAPVTQTMLLGAVVDDFEDYRPGLKAASEAGAQWPLVDAGMNKQMVRAASKARGLATWDRPAEPCLSSRFPYGEPVTVEGLRMIEAAEGVLHDLGFLESRARHHAIGQGRGWLCRIEVPVVDLPRIMAVSEDIQSQLRIIGYHHIAVDLAGFKSGGFNALLNENERQQGSIRV